MSLGESFELVSYLLSSPSNLFAPREVVMRALLAAFGGLVALGCEIAPIVSAPLDSPGTRYHDCDRAAEEYCEDSIKPAARDMDACVAEHRFKCLSSGSVPPSVSRS